MAADTTFCTGNDVDLKVEAARVPRGAEAARLPACDLVMKGGVTSGAVYPGAAIALAKSFRFTALGGTSAGAVAAGACAAAEYGRLRDSGGGFVQLSAFSEDLSKDDFLPGLFQATPRARPLMDLALSVVAHPNDSPPRRTARIVLGAFKRAPVAPVAALAALLGLVLLAWGAFRGFGAALAVALTVLVALPLAVLVVVLAVAGALALLVLRATASLRESNFGLCPGTHQDGYDEAQPALTDWLDASVQAAAGLPCEQWDKVLTVADLSECGLELETMTTDLSRARPLRCPADLAEYSFKPKEMLAVFPEHVVARMIQPDPTAPEPAADELQADRLFPLDAKRLPVLVAIRLSLSFPGLLSAVPLHRGDEGDEPRRSLLSDGGISSNFPVHFFDAWFPRRPTFGITLDAHPGGDEPCVVMHGEAGATAGPGIEGLPALGRQILDTMQNWRDNLQAELPGYRDRLCDVRLRRGEGGFNLKMKPPAIRALMKRGYRAGELLGQALPMTTPPDPPTERWSEHCLTRFETLMRLEQLGLKAVAERSGGFLAALGRGDLTPPERAAWATAAARQTDTLLGCVRAWGPPPGSVDFAGTTPRPPEAVMRIVPKA